MIFKIPSKLDHFVILFYFPYNFYFDTILLLLLNFLVSTHEFLPSVPPAGWGSQREAPRCPAGVKPRRGRASHAAAEAAPPRYRPDLHTQSAPRRRRCPEPPCPALRLLPGLRLLSGVCPSGAGPGMGGPGAARSGERFTSP